MEAVQADGTAVVSIWPPKKPNGEAQLRGRNQIPSTSMYRWRVWDRIGGYRARCRTAEDADFWCRALSFGFRAEKATDMPTLRYHVRPDSMSHVVPEWKWQSWYPWGQIPELTPYAAVHATKPVIPTHEKPLITVVIPVGPGHERLVLDAVDSLVAQTFVRWEAIVVNDTNGTLPWIHPFVKVIDTPKPGSGPAVARNLALREANASLFLPLDADDYLQPDALGLMYQVWSPDTYVYSDWVCAGNR